MAWIKCSRNGLMLQPAPKPYLVKKLNLTDKTIWTHHRTGWKCVVRSIAETLHNPHGVFTIGNADLPFVHSQKNNQPWFGFIHAVINAPLETKEMYGFQWDLTTFLSEKHKNVLEKCKGLVTFSEYAADYIRSKLDTPVSVVRHPTDPPTIEFSMNDFLSSKRIVLIGHWMRHWQALYDLDLQAYNPWPSGKYILTGTDINYKQIMKVYRLFPNGTVRQIKRLRDNQYDQLLSKFIVFLPLYDANASNALIECLVRNTPVITNRIPASEEYLGRDYPLFFESLNNLEEASALCNDMEAIAAGHEYLKNLDKTPFYTPYFLESLVNTEVYKQL